MAAQVDGLRGRQQLAAAQVVVEEEAEADHPGRPQPLVVGQNEAQRPDDVRGRAQQHLALDQRLAHQPELVVLEITQAAVDKLGARRGGGAGEVALFAKQHGEAAARRIPGDAGTVRPEEHTSELQSLMRISYAVFCLKKKTERNKTTKTNN